MESISDQILGQVNEGEQPQEGGEPANGEPKPNGELAGGAAPAEGAASAAAVEGEEKKKEKPQADDINEAKILAYLKEKKGLDYKSLDEVGKPAPAPLTDEEKAEAAEEKRKKMLVYGLETGKIKGETQYRKYIADLNKPAREIAFTQFKSERIAEDNTLTDEELENEFKEEHFEYLEEDDKKRVKAARQMEAAKADFISEQYGDIESLESEYDDFVTETNEKKAYSQRIGTIFSGLSPEISFEVKDATDSKKVHSYKFNISPESMKSLQELYKGPEYFTLFSKGKMKDEAIQETIVNSLKQKEIANIISEVANAHATAMLDEFAKGRRGIQPVRDGSQSTMIVSNGISDQLIKQNQKT